MAERDIIQNMITRLGQSQDGRMAEELGIHHADVDERTPEDLFLFSKKLATFINYYRNDIQVPAGDWSAFFPDGTLDVEGLLQAGEGQTAPHLALFLSFLQLYEKPREIVNRITGRHLDFYYKQVLRLEAKAPKADKAHVLIDLKKDSPPIEIKPEHLFSAGMDKTKVELIYAPTGKTVINTAKVASLRSLFLDRRGQGTVRYAPIANSSDGLGGDIKGDNPKWWGFGNAQLPAAEVGFAIASPVLRMKEGLRTVRVSLTFGAGLKVDAATFSRAFTVFVTGEKNWLGPYAISASKAANNLLEFSFTVPESEKGVVDYDLKIHGYSYAAKAPVVQALLKTDNTTIGYDDFKNITLALASISVDVSNVTSLTLESDAGALDPKKAFFPFGSQPTSGARFSVGYGEALVKKLSSLTIKVGWKGLPSNLATYYDGYGHSEVNNNYFTATVSFKDGGSWKYRDSRKLFESGSAATFAFDAAAPSIAPVISEWIKMDALRSAATNWTAKKALRSSLEKPIMSHGTREAPEPSGGAITFTLDKDFLNSVFRKKYVENVMKYGKGEKDASGNPIKLTLLNEPHAPAVQSISLSYKAYSDNVNLSAPSLTDFANGDIQFFHISYFGQMREHGYQRKQFAFLTDTKVSLLPLFTSEGELLIGLTKLKGGDSISLLFQVAEGSEDPDLERQQITWSVLCDNYWKPLGRSEVVLDTTNQLLRSGVITFVLPTEATTANTILPTGYLWIKAAVPITAALCQLIDVAANAVEVAFVDGGNDPGHLSASLEKDKIVKLKNGPAAVKTVKQPYASFGGQGAESDGAFHTRVAERLRHKNRCVTAWDYERIMLDAFPSVHKVKCIPHATKGDWLAPGSVLIVVIPDLKNKNAIDPLEPRVDADTLSRITGVVQKRCGMQVNVKVKNPSYQKVQLDFKVKFHSGYEFNFYSGQLNKALIQFLSPWAFIADRDISFGGRIYKSVLLDFVEEVEYVDYVTDFRMYTYVGDMGNTNDVNEVQPSAPDAILVSAEKHLVGEARDG